MTEVYTPPAHPGEVLGYEIFRRGLNQRQAARLLGMSETLIGGIINGKYGVSTTLAHRLELAGVGAALQWLTWQAEHDLWRATFLDFSDVRPFPPVVTAAPTVSPDEIEQHQYSSFSPETIARCFKIVDEFEADGRKVYAIYEAAAPRAAVIEALTHRQYYGQQRHRVAAFVELKRHQGELQIERYWQDEDFTSPVIRGRLYAVIDMQNRAARREKEGFK